MVELESARAMIQHLGFMLNHAESLRTFTFWSLPPESSLHTFIHIHPSSGDFLFYYLEKRIFSGELMISFEKEKDSPVKYNLVNSA